MQGGTLSVVSLVHSLLHAPCRSRKLVHVVVGKLPDNCYEEQIECGSNADTLRAPGKILDYRRLSHMYFQDPLQYKDRKCKSHNTTNDLHMKKTTWSRKMQHAYAYQPLFLMKANKLHKDVAF